MRIPTVMKIHGLGKLISLALILCLLIVPSCTRDKMTVTGAEYEFGKNKVNDTNYDWKEISGNRFRIIYPDTLRQRALDVAQIYDTHLESISQELMAELSSEDELMGRIYASFQAYIEIVRPWTAISDRALLNLRPEPQA